MLCVIHGTNLRMECHVITRQAFMSLLPHLIHGIILAGKYAEKHRVALNIAIITVYKQDKNVCAKFAATMHGMKLSTKKK